MTVRKILSFFENSEVLRKKSQPILDFNKDTIDLITDLKDTLKAHPDGIGLAAPQINVHLKVAVVCLGCNIDENIVTQKHTILINPTIIDASHNRRDFDGCLSFPGLYGETVRPHFMRVNHLDESGNPIQSIYEGFDAVVVHHEIDHLEGILFVDRIECMDDLYWVRKNGNNDLVKIPVSMFEYYTNLKK